MKRYITLTEGTALVTTDLHGNGAVYDHLRERFLRGYADGTLHHWVICGDLLHGYGDEADDASLRMLRDVMQLQAEMGPETVVMLCGNHEMPHIYGQPLGRGQTLYTPRFEHALSATEQRGELSREAVIDFLADLPFYAFTAAGVMFAHAGPAASLTSPQAVEQVLNFDHRALIAAIDAALAQYDMAHARHLYAQRSGRPYADAARHLLAVTDADDPRYDHLLRAFALDNFPDYGLLWDILFTTNENEYPNDMRRVVDYGQQVRHVLAQMTAHSPHPQHVIVSGHLVVQGGHMVVDDYHLRLASAEHARPQTAGQVLLLDCAKPVADADALVPMLDSTWA